MSRTASKIYVPLDVTFFGDDKILAAGERAAWLYLHMMTQSKASDSDGFLSKLQVAKLAVPGWQSRLKALLAVVDHDGGRLVTEPEPGTYYLPAYPKWNELAADHDRIVAEAEARGWNAGLELWIASVQRLLEDVPADCIQAAVYRANIKAIAALRKPEVEG